MEPSTRMGLTVSKLSSPPESTSECEIIESIDSWESTLFNRFAIRALSVVGNVTSTALASRESAGGTESKRNNQSASSGMINWPKQSVD